MSFLWRVCRTIYVWEFWWYICSNCVWGSLCYNISWWRAYLCLSSARLCPNLMHELVLKCISMFVQCTFYGVCFCSKKKKEKKKMAWRCECDGEGEHMHVCGPHSPTEVHPTLVKARCRVTQVSNGNSTQTGPHRHTHAHATHTQSRTQSSAVAKVNRWAGLNWLAVCSDCKLHWWWLENSSTGCRLLKLSRENNFLLCSGNFFFLFLSFTRLPHTTTTPPSCFNLNIMGLYVRRWKELVYKLV